MILSNTGRQHTAWRSCTSVLGKCLYAPKTQRRRKHEVPILTHDATLRKKGLRDVLSPDGYDIAWTRYQQFLVDKLNQLTAQTKDENTRTKDLLIKYARDPNHAALFNYASAAHNNHFFFETLTPSPTPIPPVLLSHIDASFSSLETLRSHFLATADSMFGPGYVWLVKRTQASINESMKLSILATYNAGSPYPGAHFRQQPVDMNTAATGVTPHMTPTGYARMMRGEEGTNQMDDRLRVYGKGYGTGNPNAPRPDAPYSGTAGAFGAYSTTSQNTSLHPESRKAPGGALIEVLLGVSTWEHVWLRDWGITGKRKFLEAWWKKVDWETVFARSGFDPSGARRS
ncbi:MAG: hypothetical protein Q9221_004976 [Calogaya cf. arnoldii]